MADKIFLDTGALYAYYDKSDFAHGRIKAYLNSAKDVFYTSNFVIDELITLMRYRNFNLSGIKPFIDDLRREKFAYLLYITPEIEELAWVFMNKYRDHLFSFTDCTSFIVMQENTIKKACALDKHFINAGFSIFPKLQK